MGALEQHFTVQQVAEKWGLSADTVRRMVRREPGVVAFQTRAVLVDRKRKPRVMLRIPLSVIERLQQRWSTGAVEVRKERRRIE